METIVLGMSFGNTLAMVISFTTHRSVLWAILHGFFAWFYVIYYLWCSRKQSVE